MRFYSTKSKVSLVAFPQRKRLLFWIKFHLYINIKYAIIKAKMVFFAVFRDKIPSFRGYLQSFWQMIASHPSDEEKQAVFLNKLRNSIPRRCLIEAIY